MHIVSYVDEPQLYFQSVDEMTDWLGKFSRSVVTIPWTASSTKGMFESEFHVSAINLRCT